MSNQIFPTLAGSSIAIKRTPVFSTMIQTTASGKELRASFQSTPRWRYEIPLNFTRITGFSLNTVSNEMATILGLFSAMAGAWDTFLYTDPYSNTASSQNIGTGNGSTTTFQLDDIEGFPIYDLNGTASIYVAGVLKTLTTHYTLSNGLVTFLVAPTAGQAVTWSGGYYRRVRFDMDEYEQEQMFNLCWNGGVLKLISVK